MAQVKIRNLDDWVVEYHRDEAKRSNKSLEQYLRDLLSDAVINERKRIAAELRANLEKSRQQYGVLPSSVDIIRDIREESSWP